MGQINIPQPTLLEELISMMVSLLLVGLVAALICLFKKAIPPNKEKHLYGANVETRKGT